MLTKTRKRTDDGGWVAARSFYSFHEEKLFVIGPTEFDVAFP